MPRSAKILLIQLSSPLTVIRSSALVYRLKNDDPNSHITYLTSWPELLPGEVSEPLAPDAAGILRLQMDQFDEAYNLGVDRRSCATMNIIDARQKMGYYLRQGDPVPLDGAAAEYLKAIAPRACGPDQPGTLQSLFQMCSLEYRRELPRLFAPASGCPQLSCQGPLIGLNTSDDSESTAKGCCWNHRHWLRLIEMLTQCGMTPLLLGNPGTDMLNRLLASNSSAVYPGPVAFGHTELSGKSNLCYYDPKELMSLSNHEGEESLPSNDFMKVGTPLSVRDFMALLGRCDVIAGVPGITTELAWSLGREVAILHSGQPVSMAGGFKTSIDSEMPDYFRSRHAIIEPLGVPQEKAGLNDILPDQVFQAILERLRHSTADKTSRSEVSPSRNFVSDTLSTERARVSDTRRRPS